MGAENRRAAAVEGYVSRDAQAIDGWGSQPKRHFLQLGRV